MKDKNRYETSVSKLRKKIICGVIVVERKTILKWV
jgi:hypothetical protein